MKSVRAIAAFLTMAIFMPLAHASGAVGIYGIIEKVEFEPTRNAPERVRVYGAFSVFHRWIPEQMATPTRGQLYFRLPVVATDADAARREWADLAAVAATGTAVAFSEFGYSGGFTTDTRSVQILQPLPPNTASGAARQQAADPDTDTLTIWPAASQPRGPLPYRPAATGVVRLGTGNHDKIIAALRKLLAN